MTLKKSYDTHKPYSIDAFRDNLILLIMVEYTDSIDRDDSDAAFIKRLRILIDECEAEFSDIKPKKLFDSFDVPKRIHSKLPEE